MACWATNANVLKAYMKCLCKNMFLLLFTACGTERQWVTQEPSLEVRLTLRPLLHSRILWILLL